LSCQVRCKLQQIYICFIRHNQMMKELLKILNKNQLIKNKLKKRKKIKQHIYQK